MNRRVALIACLSLSVAGAMVACGSDDPPPTTAVSPADTAALEHLRDQAVDAIVAARHVEWPAVERQDVIRDGRAVIERVQCNRCHTIDEIEPGNRSAHCVSCHQWLDGLTPDDRTFTKLARRYGRDIIERYQRNIVHYLEVPDLTNVAHRIEPAWIAEYVQNPHDLRPMMEETMVRSRISPEDARAIARYFAAVAEVTDPYPESVAAAQPREVPQVPSAERIAEGRRVFMTRGCNLCHTVGNIDTGKTREDLERMGMPATMAPNLRFARERMDPEAALAWILHPQRFHPDTRMPPSNLSVDDARAVRDFIFYADPELRPTPPAPELVLPPAVERPVTWAEVKEGTLGRVCVHCHMNDYERDPGPGNRGGYGWDGVGLRMRTYEMLVSGQLQAADAPDGDAGIFDPDELGRRRVSVLEAAHEGGMPRLLEVMLLRRVEERRDRIEAFEDHVLPADHGTEVLGMPMGLPHIPDDELSVLRAWIEQGCPGPTEVTGMGGIDDGLLVPDGPIANNRSCEVRLPSTERPEWATQPPPEWHRPSPNAHHQPGVRIDTPPPAAEAADAAPSMSGMSGTSGMSEANPSMAPQGASGAAGPMSAMRTPAATTRAR